jgi:hypothetical protein
MKCAQTDFSIAARSLKCTPRSKTLNRNFTDRLQGVAMQYLQNYLSFSAERAYAFFASLTITTLIFVATLLMLAG